MPEPTTFRAVMNPQALRLAVPSIEPLENRIAPATFFVGDTTRNDIEYSGNTPDEGNPFVRTLDDPTDPISALIGPNANVYYLKLNPGDRVALFGDDGSSGAGYTNYITGPSGAGLVGTVIAVFNDLNVDNEVQPEELTGLSLGNAVKIQVSGTVFGDVVANYNVASGVIGAAGDGQNLLTNTISSFGASSVTGSIVAGGAIKGVSVTGAVGQILAGTAANGLTYDFNGPAEDGGDTLNVVAVAGKAGPGISKVTVGGVTKIQAGGGGAGAAGGSITNVTLISDTDGWIIQGGDGGDGGSSRPVGGKGGNVTGVFANGLDANTSDVTENNLVQILGGQGGNGNVKGGKGGTVKNASIGYETGPKGNVQLSINSIADAVLIAGGAGGTGRVGGAGGGLVNTDVFASPTLSGNDLVLRAGAGGDSTSGGGKSGAGGSVIDFDLRNPGISAAAQQSRMFVDAGDGGLATSGSAGGKGGSVERGVFIGFSIGITGGTGAQGSNGGAGGLVRSILAQDGFFGVQPRNFSIDAGGGGIGVSGRGGKGGLIDGVTVRNGELSQFDINQGVGAGDGADSQKGPGGAGGFVSNLTVNDLDSSDSSQVVIRITAGEGGNGGTTGNGGKGGVIGGKNVIEGVNASLQLSGGEGGSATGAGSGGVGGSVGDISFNSISTGPDAAPNPPVTAVIAGGNGGVGVGTGKGGAGGSLNVLSVIANGNISITAGTGGNGGASGAVGKGGSISNGAALSSEGSVTVTAGSAGTTGLKAGAGGSLFQLNVQGETTIQVRSGDGSKGGAGGSIREIGVSDTTQAAGPTNGLEVIAGIGSANGSKGGAGGSISGVDGFIATTGNTRIIAGDGGDGTSKAGAGGSVSTITLRGGGGVGAIVDIEAGNGGTATSAKVGAKGGNVTDVGIGLNPFAPSADPTAPIDPFQVQAGTLIRHIAAGDGGAAGSGTGGTGGSIQEVRAYYDIGAMSGAVFGFSTMGGIFAGKGGAGAREGVSGSVLNVSADSIAAILAGRLENGDVITRANLASSVDGVVLNTNVPSMVNGNGKYLNYDTAGIVGAVRDPLTEGDPYPPGVIVPPEEHANTFDAGEYVDNDTSGTFSLGDATNDKTHGFVAALKFGTSAKFPTSVRPEAVFTTDDETGAIVFIDLNNTNGQVVVL